MKKYKIKNTIHEDLWDVVKPGLNRTFIALNTYITKNERAKNNSLTFHLK